MKLNEKSKSILRNIILIIVGVGTASIVAAIQIKWLNDKSEKETVEKIEHAQSRATSEISASEILYDEAKNNINEMLSKSSTNKKEAFIAAGTFTGAYLLNVRTRPEYCANFGVDISAFTKEYSKVYHDLFVSAEKIITMDYKERNKTYDKNKLYNQISESLHLSIRQDMKDTAAALNVTEKEACELFALYATKWVSELDLRKSYPEIAQILLQQ